RPEDARERRRIQPVLLRELGDRALERPDLRPRALELLFHTRVDPRVEGGLRVRLRLPSSGEEGDAGSAEHTDRGDNGDDFRVAHSPSPRRSLISSPRRDSRRSGRGNAGTRINSANPAEGSGLVRNSATAAA